MTQRLLTSLFLAAMMMLSSTRAVHAAATPAAPAGFEKAIFAGGCFWCMEQPFRGLPGVKSVLSGYSGGVTVDPSYEEVSSGGTGHAEAVEVVFDPALTSYAKLLEIFWRNIDPTVKDRQFCDVGSQYRSGIFVHSPTQRAAAEASKAALQKHPRFKGHTLFTEIVDAGPFYAAEEYHQDYANKNPLRYRYYRSSCGRDARLKEVWGAAPAH
jgi:peptide-methionine (S)-S-oxide reductase